MTREEAERRVIEVAEFWRRSARVLEQSGDTAAITWGPSRDLVAAVDALAEARVAEEQEELANRRRREIDARRRSLFTHPDDRRIEGGS